MCVVGYLCAILVFPDLSVLELGPMYATDRRQTKASLKASALWGRRHNNGVCPFKAVLSVTCEIFSVTK